MQAWLVAYLLTCAIEIPIVATCLRLVGWTPPGRGRWRGIAIAWLLQLTHPVAWLLGPYAWPQLIITEVLITLVEGAVLALVFRRAWTLALAISAVANGVSLLAGLALSGVLPR